MPSARAPVFCLALGLFFLSACSEEHVSRSGSASAQLTLSVESHEGAPLETFSLQVQHAEEGWLGSADTTYEAEQGQISADFDAHEPKVLRIGAPGYRPLFIFLMPSRTPTGLTVRLSSHPVREDPEPIVVGSFNDFVSQGGVPMEEQNGGTWAATLPVEQDTVDYLIRFYALGADLPGTEGDYVLNTEARGTRPTFHRRVVRTAPDAPLTVTFDPGRLPSAASSSIRFVGEVSPCTEGVAKIYARMIEEYLDTHVGWQRHRGAGREGRYEHDFAQYMSDLDSLARTYERSQASECGSVREAHLMAEARFTEELGMSAERADQILQSMPAGSPLWLINSPALTDLVGQTGAAKHLGLLQEAAERHPSAQVQAEALYSLMRHYHEVGDEEQWHATFFDLVSRFPDHYRTSYAYASYAPEEPIQEGERLPKERYAALDGEGTIDLHALEEDYLLLDFWATWCGPCIEALPALHEVQERFGSRSFAIVSISMDEEPKTVERFREEWPMPWYHAHVGYGDAEIREMGIVGIPRYLLLGPDRKVLIDGRASLESETLESILPQ